MTTDTFDQSLKAGIAFWIVVLAVFIWWAWIRPADIRLLIPSFWWVDWCATSPAFVFLFNGCSASATVANTDSILLGFAIMFVIMVLWLVQFMVVSLAPVFVFEWVTQWLNHR